MALLKEINREGVRDRQVLEAIATVPRDEFVEPELRPYAWANRALPIGSDQTISQPVVVGMMTQALRLRGHERVLEIGTGSGYQTAILAQLSHSVVSVERHADLSAGARRVLDRLSISNVELVVGDGTLGWAERAPYDRILVTAAAPAIPPTLLDQLADADSSRLVIPVGTIDDQHLFVIERQEGTLRQIALGPVRFVPLVGEEGHRPGDEPGWREDWRSDWEQDPET